VNEWSYAAAPVAANFRAVARGMKAGFHPRMSVCNDRDKMID